MANQRLRGAIIAIGATVIVGYGAYTGAQLKTEHEVKAKSKAYKEATNEEQIALLQGQRQLLTTKRNELARKLKEVEDRIQKYVRIDLVLANHRLFVLII